MALPWEEVDVLTLQRHGVSIRFDDEGFSELPYVYRPLLEDKLYEEAFLDHIRSLSRSGVYVDAGAHLGTHTVWFAKLCPSTRVYAFEPIPRYAEVVRCNVVANGLARKVKVHQVGLSDRKGRAANRLGPEHQWGFVEGEAQAVDEEFPVARLDDMVRGRVTVLKLDVEGMSRTCSEVPSASCAGTAR